MARRATISSSVDVTDIPTPSSIVNRPMINCGQEAESSTRRPRHSENVGVSLAKYVDILELAGMLLTNVELEHRLDRTPFVVGFVEHAPHLSVIKTSDPKTFNVHLTVGLPFPWC